MATYDNIPLTWNDPLLSGATTSGAVNLQNGGTLSYRSITDDGAAASVLGYGSFNLDHVRIDSSEGVRIAGSGNINISNSYLEATGSGSDHADVIQAYAPGSTGNVTITNTTIVAHNTAATAGMFVADDYAGTFTFNNVVFEGGPFGLRIHADERDISVSLTDVYFVGPFMYDPIYLLEVNGDIHITHWENVRYATIVNGELVPGALISPPFPVEGGGGSVVSTTIDDFSTDSGTDGDGITNDSTLTLTGHAAANSSVKVFDGTTPIGTTTANGSGTWSYTTAALSNGSHSLTATATSSGTSTTSSALGVRIDTTAPNVPTIATPTTTANGSLNLTGSAEAGSVVRVYDNGSTLIGTATANSSGAWSYTTGALATGSHSLTARATDVAGNTSVTSAGVTATIGTSPAPTPPAAPTIASVSNDSGTANDHITNDSTLTLTGHAAANSTVRVFDGATQLGIVTADGGGAWTYTTAALSDGNHSLTARATTTSGTSAASSAFGMTIDTAAPIAPSIVSYTDGGTTASATTQSLAAATAGTTDINHVTLNGTAEANSTVRVYDGATQIGTATTTSTGTWSYNASNLVDGSHSFTSRAVDAAGNASTPSTALNVSVDTHTDASTFEFTSAYQRWNDKVVVRGTADPYDQISIYDNGGTQPVGTIRAGSDGSFALTTSALSDNVVHRFTATVTDSTGHISPTSSTVVLGTSGDNHLASTSGDDLFRGNGGHDAFEFAGNFGNDVIADFGAGRRGHDVVEFSSTVFHDFASVLAHASQVGHDVVIDAGGGNTLTLQNTSLSSLDRTDFHFA